MKLAGYAAIFDALTAEPFAPRKSFDFLNLHARFASGCFDSSFKYDDHEIKVLLNHQDAEIYARRTDGSLHLEVDDVGLKFTMEVNDVAHPRLLEFLPRIRGMSCGFNTFDARTELVHGEQVWTINEAWLHEVSFAERPRWPQTSCRVIAPALPALPLRYVSLAMRRRHLELEVSL